MVDQYWRNHSNKPTKKVSALCNTKKPSKSDLFRLDPEEHDQIQPKMVGTPVSCYQKSSEVFVTEITGPVKTRNTI